MESGGGRSKLVDEYVRGLQPAVREIVAALRDVIFEAEPRIEEDLKSGHPSYSRQGHVCDVIALKDRVILGFLKGVGLVDPTNLLQGTGKRYREAEFRQLEDVKKEESKALIRAAVQLNVEQER